MTYIFRYPSTRPRFVQRSDFRHQTARTWGETQWVAFRAFMTRDEITRRFGEKIGKEIALDADPMGDDDDSRREGKSGTNSAVPKAAVWEIWDKAKNRVIWISPDWPDVLESGPPILILTGSILVLGRPMGRSRQIRLFLSLTLFFIRTRRLR